MLRTSVYILSLILVLLLVTFGGCENSRRFPWHGLQPVWHTCGRLCSEVRHPQLWNSPPTVLRIEPFRLYDRELELFSLRHSAVRNCIS